MRLQISRNELMLRQSRLASALRDHGYGGMCLFGPAHIFYLTGFAFIPTERPIGLILAPPGSGGASSQGGPATLLLVPRLEQEHAAMMAAAGRVESYPEYPGQRHPMEHFADRVREMGLGSARLAVDSDGFGGGYGYAGPKLSELLPEAQVTAARELVERPMRVKSGEEVELIRESARWANLAHSLLQEYTRPGLTETEVSLRASAEATAAMIRALGPSYRSLSAWFTGAHAGYRGQVGPHSAIPHAVTTNARFRPGDVLVSGASAAVGGYISELERTMVIAPVSEEARRFFQHMLALQETAFEAIRPGRRCSDVDAAVRAYFEKHDLMRYWRHHTGHGLGIGIHEAPFFDVGDQAVIEPGMVFSVEPGIYVPGLGGFRHSDTILVTGDGIEILTYYPRDLASLTIG
ncbi:MAG: Xaa-Pro peptidase family protein [Bacillota bacterium]